MKIYPQLGRNHQNSAARLNRFYSCSSESHLSLITCSLTPIAGVRNALLACLASLTAASLKGLFVLCACNAGKIKTSGKTT